MDNKKYISQVLICLFSGMIIPIFMIFISKYYIHRVDTNFMCMMGFSGLIGFVLEASASSKFDKTKNKIWILAQILFYLSFWIFIGIFLGTVYICVTDAGYIVLCVYGFAVLVTLICLIIGLCSKDIKVAKRRNIIWGLIISSLTIIFGAITKSHNYFVTLALLFIVFLCCYYSVKQFNSLKVVKHFNSKSEKLSNIINTSMDMGFTFVMLVLVILAILFPSSDDDD